MWPRTHDAAHLGLVTCFCLLFLLTSGSAERKATQREVEQAGALLQSQANKLSQTSKSLGQVLQQIANSVKGAHGQIRLRPLERLTGVPLAPCSGPACPPKRLRSRMKVDNPLDLEPLFGYGCWCFFDRPEHNLGRSQAVDEFDTICQRLTTCFKCAVMDSNASCDPYNVEFEAEIDLMALLGGTSTDTESECRSKNDDDCATGRFLDCDLQSQFCRHQS